MRYANHGPAFAYVNGLTVGVTLHRISEPVTGRVTAHRCLVRLGAQLSCRRGERPGRLLLKLNR